MPRSSTSRPAAGRARATDPAAAPTARLAALPVRAATDEPVWAAGAEGISYNPVRDGDATAAFGEPPPAWPTARPPSLCPRCGGATQIDLFDQVHQTTSLSCLACFHMFRVEA